MTNDSLADSPIIQRRLLVKLRLLPVPDGPEDNEMDSMLEQACLCLPQVAEVDVTDVTTMTDFFQPWEEITMAKVHHQQHRLALAETLLEAVQPLVMRDELRRGDETPWADSIRIWLNAEGKA